MSKRETEHFIELLEAYSNVGAQRDEAGNITIDKYIKGFPSKMLFENGVPVRVVCRTNLYAVDDNDQTALQIDVFDNTNTFDHSSLYRQNPDDSFIVKPQGTEKVEFIINLHNSSLDPKQVLGTILQGLELLHISQNVPERNIYVYQVQDRFYNLFKKESVSKRIMEESNPFLSLDYTRGIVTLAKQDLH